jgi:hypothetical protein
MTQVSVTLPRAHVPILIHFLIEVEGLTISIPETKKMPTSDADADLTLIEVVVAAFAGGAGASFGKSIAESITSKIIDAYKEGANLATISTSESRVAVDETSSDSLKKKLEQLLRENQK